MTSGKELLSVSTQKNKWKVTGIRAEHERARDMAVGNDSTLAIADRIVYLGSMIEAGEWVEDH